MRGRMRCGLTLIEVLIVISIIGMLAALTMPAVNAIRETGRRAVCLHKMRELGLAVQQYENHHRHYPGWRHFFTVADMPHATSWTVLTLPYLQRGDIYRSFQEQGSTAENTVSLRELLICPSDFQKMLTTGPSTSFIGNTGRVDRFDLAELNDLPPDSRTNGVFMHIYQYEHVPEALH